MLIIKIELLTYWVINYNSINIIITMSDKFESSCGHGRMSKSYHRSHNIYYCQWCEKFGGFTPFKLENFAPFTSESDAKQCQEAMQKEFTKIYQRNPNIQIVVPKMPPGWS